MEEEAIAQIKKFVQIINLGRAITADDNSEKATHLYKEEFDVGSLGK